MALPDGTIRAPKTLRLLLIIGWSILSLLVQTSVHCRSSVADSYPVVIEDGSDNYLILNDDEVANNSQLLKFLSSASKEDVEEIVDSNPRVQEAILGKIKSAVDRRAKSKASSSIVTPSKQISVNKQATIEVPKGQAIIVHGQDDQQEQEENDEEYDDEPDIDDKQIVMWKSKFKNGAAKMFKIGAGVRDKLLEIYKKRGKKKQPTRKPQSKLSWPHFHYKITTT